MIHKIPYIWKVEVGEGPGYTFTTYFVVADTLSTACALAVSQCRTEFPNAKMEFTALGVSSIDYPLLVDANDITNFHGRAVGETVAKAFERLSETALKK